MYIHTYHRYVYIYISHHIYIYMMWCYFTSLNEGHTSCHCGPTQTCHNLNSGQSWWFPFLTIIPVRENSEVVIIYPAYSHIYVISDCISHIVCIYIYNIHIYIYIHITQSKCIYIYVLYIHLNYIYICIINIFIQCVIINHYFSLLIANYGRNLWATDGLTNPQRNEARSHRGVGRHRPWRVLYMIYDIVDI